MCTSLPISRRGMLFVLHPVFALTGIADAITGPMLPALAHTFHLSDSQSGILLFSIFAGMATGALLCRGNYARILMIGLVALALSCVIFPWVPRTLLYPFAFFFGMSVGSPMTAVSLFAGRNYPAARASTLTMLNFTWSLGALMAPLIAGRLLAISAWQTVYLVLAGTAAVAAMAVSLTIRDSAEPMRLTPETAGLRNISLVALFAVFFFLEVGVESTFGAWTSTYVLRTTGITVSFAAAATAIYWSGFLASRGLSPLLLSRVGIGSLIQVALLSALGASILLVISRSLSLQFTAILLVGAGLAPVFPMTLSAFFDRARHSSDSRFVLAVSGFGASVIPWLVGLISSHTGSLRIGLLMGPVVLLVMTAMLPLLRISRPVVGWAAPEEHIE